MKKKVIDYHISYGCTNQCDFCSEFFQLQRLPGYFVPLLEINKNLTKKRNEGFDFVHFTGGEPTLHPDIVEILRSAKKLGYKIQIGSNGSLLKNLEFCRKILPYLDCVSLSVHGHSAAIHDGLVHTKGAFSDIRKSLQNFRKLHFKNIFANVVVSNRNRKVIVPIIRFLADEGCVQVLVSNIAPEGAAEVNYAELAPRMSRWKEMIPKIQSQAEKRNIIIHFFGLPLCVVKNLALLNDVSWDPRVTIEIKKRKGKKENIITGSQSPMRKRIKPPACGVCAYAHYCCGIFRHYYTLYGDSELKPFS